MIEAITPSLAVAAIIAAVSSIVHNMTTIAILKARLADFTDRLSRLETKIDNL